MERVELFDQFTNKKTGRESHAYRVTYRSMDRSLTNEEVGTNYFTRFLPRVIALQVVLIHPPWRSLINFICAYASVNTACFCRRALQFSTTLISVHKKCRNASYSVTQTTFDRLIFFASTLMTFVCEVFFRFFFSQVHMRRASRNIVVAAVI